MATKEQLAHQFSRRELLLSSAGLAAASLYGAKSDVQHEALKGESLYRDVVAYCSLGEHRTGTDVDIKTSKWLAAEFARSGLK